MQADTTTFRIPTGEALEVKLLKEHSGEQQQQQQQKQPGAPFELGE